MVEFFGDSRALDWPAPPMPSVRFVNRGIWGQTTEQIRNRFDAHVIPVYPRVLVLQAGVNDLKAIVLFPGRRDEIVSTCKANLHQIVARATDAGITVVVTAIFPAGKVPLHRRAYWSPEVDRAIDEVNLDLRSLASDRVVVFDAWKVLEQDGRVPPEFSKDTLHLRPAGYGALNQELARILKVLPALQQSDTRPSGG